MRFGCVLGSLVLHQQFLYDFNAVFGVVVGRIRSNIHFKVNFICKMPLFFILSAVDTYFSQFPPFIRNEW